MHVRAFLRRSLVVSLLGTSPILAWWLIRPDFGRGAHPGAQGSAAIANLRKLARVRTGCAATDGAPDLASLLERDAAWLEVGDAAAIGSLRSGYRFRVWEVRPPALAGTRAAEPLAAPTFVAQAWPESEATLDDRLFVLDVQGTLWSARDAAGRWRGASSPLPATAGDPCRAGSAPARREDDLGLLWTPVPDGPVPPTSDAEDRRVEGSD